MSVHEGMDAAWREDEEKFAAVAAALEEGQRTALFTHRALVRGEQCSIPDYETLPDAQSRVCIAVARARRALLDWDHAGLLDAAAVLRSAGSGWAETSEGWAAVLEGGAQPSLDQRTTSDAALAIEQTTLRGWLALCAGDFEEALRLARRASRMARNESMPRQEYLAGVLLARMRRSGGRAHLGARILTALRRTAPPPWHEWLDWELRFVGTPSDSAASMTDWLDVLASRDEARIEAARSKVALQLEHCAPLKRDFATVVAGVTGSSDEAAAPFQSGAEHSLPGGIEGAVCDGSTAVAWVMASPEAAIRVLAPGITLFDAEPIETGTRTDKALCALALAGSEGVELESFFERVYGFGYKQELHSGALRVLLHRSRDACERYATVERSEGRLKMTIQKAFRVADPRVSINDPLTHLLASCPGLGVQEIARRLGIPYRTVQNQLRHLVSEGICITSKVGRRVLYSVDDTTFADPTRV